MNELRRMAYLDAIGVASYISRTQLPGAAATRRLAIVRRYPETNTTTARAAATSAAPPVIPFPDVVAPPAAPKHNDTSRTARGEGAATQPAPAVSPKRAAIPRFSLTAIIAGEWLWLEDLAGMPLAREQVQLVQAMAQALLLNRQAARDAAMRVDRTDAERLDEPRPDAARPDVARPDVARPDVAQFDWPIHTNAQLDLSDEAARASVTGFVGRRLEQYGCRGLVLLGQACSARVSLADIQVQVVMTASSAELLAQPALKQQAWRELLTLVRPR